MYVLLYILAGRASSPGRPPIEQSVIRSPLEARSPHRKVRPPATNIRPRITHLHGEAPCREFADTHDRPAPARAANPPADEL